MDISSMNAKTMSMLFIAVFTLSRRGMESFFYKALSSKCFRLARERMWPKMMVMISFFSPRGLSSCLLWTEVQETGFRVLSHILWFNRISALSLMMWMDSFPWGGEIGRPGLGASHPACEVGRELLSTRWGNHWKPDFGGGYWIIGKLGRRMETLIS